MLPSPYEFCPDCSCPYCGSPEETLTKCSKCEYDSVCPTHGCTNTGCKAHKISSATVRYGVAIDNGASYSASLPARFTTYEEAEDAGNDWLTQFYYDNGYLTEQQQEECEAGFEVFEEGETL